MNVINISNLKKSYDGKITTVRVLNVILSSTSGPAEISGKPVNEHNIELHRLCGVMTESSSCYENLTAKENLIFFGKMYGFINIGCIL